VRVRGASELDDEACAGVIEIFEQITAITGRIHACGDEGLRPDRTAETLDPTMDRGHVGVAEAAISRAQLVDAIMFAHMIRSHWGIENQLHWCLDVGFREDESRIRTDHGPENLALLRKIALNLAKNERTHKAGLQAKRKLASWSNPYLLKLLFAGLNSNQAK